MSTGQPGMGQAWARHGASGSNGAKLMMSSWSHDVWATFSLHLCISHGLSWQSQSCLIIPSEKNWILWMLESWLGHNHPAVFAAKLLQYFLGNNLTLALAFFKQSSLPVYPISILQLSGDMEWAGTAQWPGKNIPMSLLEESQVIPTTSSNKPAKIGDSTGWFMANFGRVSGNCIRFKHGYHVYNVYRVHPCNPGYIRFLKSKDLAKSGHLVDDVANGPCGPNFLVLAIRRPPPQHPEFPWKNVVASRTVENLDENLTISDNFLN